MKPFPISDDDEDIRLDRWMKRNVPHVTHSLLEKALRKGWVKVDKKKTTASSRLKAGQLLEIAPSLLAVQVSEKPYIPKVQEINPRDVEMLKRAVIYEDDELIAINKPAGLAVQGGSKQTVSIDMLAHGLVPVGMGAPKLVHRLDRDTSGVLLLAKNARSAAALSKMFASQGIEKQYIALVIGLPKPRRGKIDMPLIKAVRGKNSTMEKVDVDVEDGLDAVTMYEVISSAAQKYSWVHLYPLTGRTHQLRVHMASIGHPIVGDGKYGGADSFIRGGDIAEQLHLHAAKVTIERKGRKTLVIEAPLPPHMEQSQALIG